MVTPRTAVPIGVRPSSGSGSSPVMSYAVAMTWASVGPYELMIFSPGTAAAIPCRSRSGIGSTPTIQPSQR